MTRASLSWKDLQEIVGDKERVREALKGMSDEAHNYSSRPGRIPLSRPVQESDDPRGYGSKVFEERKEQIVKDARSGRVIYTEQEKQIWRKASTHMAEQNSLVAWDAHQNGFKELANILDLSHKIPQLQDFADAKTCFQPVPVCGYTDKHLFIPALGHHLFPCSPYIRPALSTDFSKEPDLFHEVIGHLCSLQDEHFGNLHYHIGLAAQNIVLRSEEKDGKKFLKQIGAVYWYTMETGVTKQKGQLKAYGGAILSSFEESRKAFADPHGDRFKPFDAAVVLTTRFSDQTYQPYYFVSPPHEAWDLALKHWKSECPELFRLCSPLNKYLDQYFDPI